MNEMRRLPIHPDAPPTAARHLHVHAAPHLRFPFGRRLVDSQPVFWDSKSAIDRNMIIAEGLDIVRMEGVVEQPPQ